ncbi:MAG: DUF2061 domain-containing protein [Candidatus Omnitrophica bacterium]|nr:DUF2061 domain-containing protein [Candidatus Omnitrophota bacterium]
MEQHRRTLVKTITWRVIALFTTIIVVYAYSGDVKKSFVVGGVANGLKMIFYYVHERVWNRSKFGITKPPEYQI